MLKLNKEIAGKWYDGVDFEDSHLVTADNHNKELGIAGIILKNPNSTGKNGRVFGSATIRFVNGLTVFGSLYIDRAGDGLTFSVDQRKGDNDEYYDINVRVPMSIQAQVIRYAMTKAEEVAHVPAAPAVQETVQQTSAAQPEQQTVYQAPAQQQPVYQASAQQAPAQTAPVQAAPAAQTAGFSDDIIQSMAAKNNIDPEVLRAQLMNM